MIFSNIHTHTSYCDGKNTAEEYIKKAMELGFKSIGFSSHAPVNIASEWHMQRTDLDRYFDELDRLKEKYDGKIQVYSGLEMDYLLDDAWKLTLDNAHRIDYTIGSVHYLYHEEKKAYFSTDGPKDIFDITFSDYAGGDIKHLLYAYYAAFDAIIKTKNFEIIGHLDVIKKNNANNLYFNEQEAWYQDLIETILKEIATTNKIIEVNTGGINRGYIQEPYPSYWIIKRIKERNIPIILTSDAHRVEDLNGQFEPVRQTLRDIGFKEQMILLDGRWQETVL